MADDTTVPSPFAEPPASVTKPASTAVNSTTAASIGSEKPPFATTRIRIPRDNAFIEVLSGTSLGTSDRSSSPWNGRAMEAHMTY